ncbi:sesquiterpene alcohol synthase-like [Halyomorpha halys]|uniref:sesquiterpene alcohol synthase-like n=1 Tax=Halyomorpha halys TaxID=286706 RepID=UPI0006D4FA52|nr:chrysanthemyl diphosphate synthase, chloroplastic-like [Halyomorpha halys]
MANMAGKSLPKLRGAIFGQFTRRKQLVKRHWLDTKTDQYYDVLRSIVIPECKNIASHVPGYSDRIEKLLTYNIPPLSDAWNFATELVYRTVADESHQTDENITKMYILRASMDLSYGLGSIIDDMSDKSEYRKGKKTWHAICEGGKATAVYDGIQVGLFPLYLFKNHFKNDPGYTLLIETVVMAYIRVMIGQTVDIHGQLKKSPSMAEYKVTADLKSGQFCAVASALGAIHAGILSHELINKTMEIFHIASLILQMWDDFNDYYSSSEQTGKPPCDLINGTTSWVSAKAMETFTASQAAEFMECYGSADADKIKRVKELYNEIDMPRLYTENVLEKYNHCQTLIKTLPHEKLREACSSYLEWFVIRETADDASDPKVTNV